MKKLKIIYEDKNIIVVDKPSGLLTVASNKEKFNTLYHEVREYIKKQNPHQKVFIVHRLDKDTSGVVLFAKNEKMKHLLQNNWANICEVREYIAIIEGIMPKKQDRLVNYLKENKYQEVYVADVGKLAITNYEVFKTKGKNSLLKISIETGRKNQIRAQLAYINHPIIGDKKYFAKSNIYARLALHASKLIIKIPNTPKTLVFEAPWPKFFTNF